MITRKGTSPEGHFRIDTLDGGSYHSCNKSETSASMAEEDSFNTPLSAEQPDATIDEIKNGASVFQTSLNMAKMCMGTGTLALPFAATEGGLLFNIIGLLLIGMWNYYSANCLLRCMEYTVDCADNDEQQYTSYGAIETNMEESATTRRYHSPPPGTTAYGKVAWHASGYKGKMAIIIYFCTNIICVYYLTGLQQHSFHHSRFDGVGFFNDIAILWTFDSI